MKLLYVVHSFPPFHWRGTEVYTLELASALAARHQSHVFYLRDDPAASAPTLEDDTFRGLAVHRCRMRLDPADPTNYFFPAEQEQLFRKLLNRLRPDVVHLTYLAGGLSLNLAALARAAGAKVFLTLTDFSGLCPRAQLVDRDGRPCPGPRAGLRCAWCLFGRTFLDRHSRIDRLLRERLPVGLTELLHDPGLDLVRRRRDAVQAAFNAAEMLAYPNPNCARLYRAAGFSQKHLVMDYGIDTRPFAGHEKTRSDVPRIGFVGQLLPHKGLDLLARAAERLPGDFRLIVHGSAEDPGAAAYLESCRLPASAELRGTFPFERMNEVLAGLDILVVPSRWQENCPLIVKYGLATRTWTIIADQPGMIADRRSSALRPFRPEDPDDLARVLVEALAAVREGRGPAAGDTGVTDMAEQAGFYEAAYRRAKGSG